MFSGIISQTTDVLGQERVPNGLRLRFRRPSRWHDLALGESIATDGICLTVETLEEVAYTVTLVPQTLRATTFGQTIPTRINLERALRVGDRISGHFVQGHVDDVGQVAKLETTGEYKIWISYPPARRALIVEKGSITVNGVALTVAAVETRRFCMALVPFTLEHTTLGTLAPGDSVNLEYDVLGKYAVQAIEQRSNG